MGLLKTAEYWDQRFLVSAPGEEQSVICRAAFRAAAGAPCRVPCLPTPFVGWVRCKVTASPGFSRFPPHLQKEGKFLRTQWARFTFGLPGYVEHFYDCKNFVLKIRCGPGDSLRAASCSCYQHGVAFLLKYVILLP